jgi:hypothetical protein
MIKRKRTRTKGPARSNGRYWLDDPRNVDRIAYALYAICAILIIIDMFVERHGPFAVEHLFGFYGVFGFVACVALVLAAKELRKIIMRPENYYDR